MEHYLLHSLNLILWLLHYLKLLVQNLFHLPN